MILVRALVIMTEEVTDVSSYGVEVAEMGVYLVEERVCDNTTMLRR